MTDLLIVRHGQASHNLAARWEGWGTSPLTPLGRQQAEAVARRLASWSPAVARLYVSPLVRARQTAELIARYLELAPVIHEGLREIDFGQVAGLTQEAFSQAMPQVYARWLKRRDLSFQFPGGEQRLAFYQRVGRALDEIVARSAGQTVVVVAHGGSIRAGLAHLFPETMQDWWAYALDNGSLTHVRAEGEDKVLVALNDCQHMEGGQLDERTPDAGGTA